jgi:flagellar biosynthesis chaperone FliJ
MTPFRFRAAAVLDVRRGQHELAQTQLAHAQQERDAAARVVCEAEEAGHRAEREYRASLDAGAAADALERHRTWIARRQAETDDRRRQLEERHLAVHHSAANVRRTYTQVRVLERLRDRAWRKYQDDVRHREAVEMDYLAVIQYARRMGGGIDCDD